jgi:putative DeoR family transcriptional regulator (stage III sporulation protein D)
LKTDIEGRACELAAYIIETRATVRAAAKKFNISKSTVHKDLTDRLEDINMSLYVQVKEILEFNKSERHIRGGMATKLKYKTQEARASGAIGRISSPQPE